VAADKTATAGDEDIHLHRRLTELRAGDSSLRSE
jgi:hypothetical protein